jgi:hypothetical protein
LPTHLLMERDMNRNTGWLATLFLHYVIMTSFSQVFSVSFKA